MVGDKNNNITISKLLKIIKCLKNLLFWNLCVFAYRRHPTDIFRRKTCVKNVIWIDSSVWSRSHTHSLANELFFSFSLSKSRISLAHPFISILSERAPVMKRSAVEGAEGCLYGQTVQGRSTLCHKLNVNIRPLHFVT